MSETTCYIEAIGRRVQEMGEERWADIQHQFYEAMAAPAAPALRETGRDIVTIKADWVIALITYLDAIGGALFMPLVLLGMDEHLLNSIKILQGALIAAVDREAFIRDCLVHHQCERKSTEDAGPEGAASSAADLLRTLGFTDADFSRLGGLADGPPAA